MRFDQDFSSDLFDLAGAGQSAAAGDVLNGEYWMDEARGGHIAELAFGHARARGFAPGYALEDWLAALAG